MAKAKHAVPPTSNHLDRRSPVYGALMALDELAAHGTSRKRQVQTQVMGYKDQIFGKAGVFGTPSDRTCIRTSG